MSLADMMARLSAVDPIEVEGRVRSVVGLAVRATIAGVRIGELVTIGRQAGPALLAEVVGLSDDEATLLPLGSSSGVAADDPVKRTSRPLCIQCSEQLLGRVVDGLGQPIDGLGPITGPTWSVMRPSPNPISRPRISCPLPLGIRAIDGLLTIGKGQRIGLFAGSGVGKSVLLGQIARQTTADIFVACLIGERGREVREFIEDSLGQPLQRGVVVCATSDAPALVRLKTPFVATAIAEWFRDQGKNVLLLMDSVTRFARAAREVGLAASEAPARRGYPPSVFAALPSLLERCGTSETGTITGIFTVLVEGGDLEEPIADEIRGILDGHIVLSRALAARGHFPAIDVGQSLSRVMGAVTDSAHQRNARLVREHIATYEAKRDLISLGAYQRGSDARLDDAIDHIDAIEDFLRQSPKEHHGFQETQEKLQALV